MRYFKVTLLDYIFNGQFAKKTLMSRWIHGEAMGREDVVNNIAVRMKNVTEIKEPGQREELFSLLESRNSVEFANKVNQKTGLLGKYIYDLSVSQSGHSLFSVALDKADTFADILLDAADKRGFWGSILKMKWMIDAIKHKNANEVDFLIERGVPQSLDKEFGNVVFDYMEQTMTHPNFYDATILKKMLASGIDWLPHHIADAIVVAEDVEMAKCATEEFGISVVQYKDFRNIVAQKSDDMVFFFMDVNEDWKKGDAFYVEPNLYCLTDSTAVIQRLHDEGMDINEEATVADRSPLWQTINPEAFKLLVALGARKDITSCGDSVWKHIMKCGPDMVKAALESGFSATESPSEYCTKPPVMYAKDKACLDLLCEAGADVNATNHWKRTALMETEDLAYAADLLVAGANIALTDEDRNNALHLAVLKGQFEKVAWLVEKGCPTDQLNYEGHTPLALARAQYAKNKRYKDIIMLLERYEQPNGATLVAHGDIQKRQESKTRSLV